LDTADPRTRVVQAGYDAMAERYQAWGAAVQGDPRDRFLDLVMSRLADAARVLDLGCGQGVPSTLRLAERFEVTGVDDADGHETWLGVPMFFSSHPPQRNRELLRQAGLRIEVDELVTMQEPEQEVTFQWVIATPAG
jgi:SAM-dependent methyltransferase